MTDPTRLLIVDDSALYRQAIGNLLREAEDVTVVGIAKDGVDALEKIAALDPDLLTLDVQMPDMDGIDVLREISRRRLRPKAIMVSSLTSEGAQVTTDALLEGAFDFILKPWGSDPAENRRQLQAALDEKITAFREGQGGRARRERVAGSGTTDAPAGVSASGVCRAVIIGASTGGPMALKTVLPELPADFPAPVLVVQHMPPKYTTSLAKRLDSLCALNIAEAQDGDVVEPGRVLIAPGGRHMKVVGQGADMRVRVTDAPPEHGCRPAADYLMRSVAKQLDGRVLGVILTGMGKDGVEGCSLLKQGGGAVIAQHEDGCAVYGMPKAVAEKGLADWIVPLERIGRSIVQYAGASRSDVTGNAGS